MMPEMSAPKPVAAVPEVPMAMVPPLLRMAAATESLPCRMAAPPVLPEAVERKGLRATSSLPDVVVPSMLRWASLIVRSALMVRVLSPAALTMSKVLCR